MKLKLITPPTAMPVTLEEAKVFFRVTATNQDSEITRVIKMATEQAENITNRQLNKAVYEGYLDSFVTSQIPKPPLVSVQKVEYVDINGVKQLFTDYTVDDLVEPAIIRFDLVPTDVKDDINVVIVTFECGYDVVPASVQSFVLNTGLTRFENRESEVLGVSADSSIGPNVKSLLNSLRVVPV